MWPQCGVTPTVTPTPHMFPKTWIFRLSQPGDSRYMSALEAPAREQA
jgi:hypothetical protein